MTCLFEEDRLSWAAWRTGGGVRTAESGCRCRRAGADRMPGRRSGGGRLRCRARAGDRTRLRLQETGGYTIPCDTREKRGARMCVDGWRACRKRADASDRGEGTEALALPVAYMGTRSKPRRPRGATWARGSRRPSVWPAAPWPPTRSSGTGRLCYRGAPSARGPGPLSAPWVPGADAGRLGGAECLGGWLRSARAFSRSPCARLGYRRRARAYGGVGCREGGGGGSLRLQQ